MTGRLKDQINVGGLKFHPREVEDVLKTFPGVAEGGVVGVSDWGPDERELVVAAVVLEDAEAEVDATACERHCLDSLERYMVPERFVKVSAIPRTDTGKLKRHELTRLVRDRLEEEAQC